ncbi:MAG: DUF3341 domain-containing protein [Thermoanaerobaculia bacterium]
MAERYMMAVFTDEAHAVAAVRDLAAAGHAPLDVYAPYAVHALERAMGIPRSRLGMVCALAGFLGAGSILFFQYWTSAVDWRLNVGGKPLFSFPAFVPVTFEVGVLLAAVATVLAFFWRSRLYPGKDPGLVHPRVTDDRFVIVLEEKDAAFDRERVRDLCLRNHAVEIEERPMPTGA